MTQASPFAGPGRPSADTVLERFEQWARDTPGAPAVITRGGDLSYAGLDARANRLAHHLLARGLPADARVAIAPPAARTPSSPSSPPSRRAPPTPCSTPGTPAPRGCSSPPSHPTCCSPTPRGRPAWTRARASRPCSRTRKPKGRPPGPP
ncbi:AMP-binding protein, partial [Streptomyces katrae]|uniref:AMP-binding protein n=1 Tax=Streptomyces katrae TaxID=68223 RepID=UPI0012FE907E